MNRRPMWLPPSFARMFTYEVVLNGVTLVATLIVALFLLGWIHP